MSSVKWIKLTVNVFDDEKFDAIRTLPDGNDIQLAWIKLLCLAGTCNESGFLMLTKEIPYTDEMLASRFHMDIGVVQRAMLLFQRLEMVEVVDNIYMVSNWLKYQSGDSLEDIRRKDRERQARHRAKQKLLKAESEEKEDMSRDSHVTVTGFCSNSNILNNTDISNTDSNINTSNKNKDNNNSNININNTESSNKDISINDNERYVNESSTNRKSRFIPPTVEEVDAYCIKNNLAYIDPENFVDFYGSKGWMVGKNKMTNWHQAASGWNRRAEQRGEKPYRTSFPKAPVKEPRRSGFEDCPDELWNKLKDHFDANGLKWEEVNLTEHDIKWMRRKGL